MNGAGRFSHSNIPGIHKNLHSLCQGSGSGRLRIAVPIIGGGEPITRIFMVRIGRTRRAIAGRFSPFAARTGTMTRSGFPTSGWFPI